MQRSILLLVFVACVVNLMACTAITTKDNQGTVYMAVADLPCSQVIKSVIEKLEEDKYSFHWKDQSKGLLSIGPIIDDGKAAEGFVKVRQFYQLSFRCTDELFTSIANQVVLEGLDKNGKWVAIVDTPVVEDYGMQFLDRLKL